MGALERTEADEPCRARPQGLRESSWPIAFAAALVALADLVAPAQAQTASDPRAAKARAVLETHCARCHQHDRLAIPAPAANLADIIDLERIARDPSLIVPGNADASRLYTLVLRGEMPFTTPNNPAKDEAPTSADVEALRDWIEALPRAQPSCNNPSRISREAVSNEIAKPDTDSDTRFLSLTHLYNTCAGEPLLRGYRQAAAKLINGISSGPRPVRLEAVGDQGALLKVQLSDIGVKPAQWDELTAGNPLGRALGLGSKIATIDWLAARLASPEVYYGLAGVPDKLDEWLASLGVDRSAAPPRRLIARTSQLTRGNRLIEHHAGRNGSVWVVYDFAGSEGPRDLLANPLGPHNGSSPGPATSNAFKPDGIRVIATRPNGFLTWAVFDADGRRLNAVPTDIEAGALFGGSGPAPGSCQSCHQSGPKPAADDLRAYLANNSGALPKAIQDVVLALHPTETELLQLFTAETLRYRHSLSAAGIDPDLRVEGVEPVSALAISYRRPVSLVRAGEEIGLDAGSFEKRLVELDGEAKLLARRLAQGAVPREEAERLLDLLHPMPGMAEPKTATGTEQQIRDIALVPDKLIYKSGELATLTVRAGFACNLTLISINPTGKATVLFPNDFEPDNAMPAGKERVIPAPGAGYRLRLTEKGKERLVAICMGQSKLAEGIQQNFELQRFTALGDWRNFLRNFVDGVEPENGKAEKSDTGKRGRGAQRVKTKDADAPKRPRGEPQARAAIDITVE